MKTNFDAIMDCLYLASDLIKIKPEYPKGIKRHYLYILYAIENLDKPARITDIAQNLLISSPNITAWVNEMENLNLVKRQPSEEDKRVNFIYITDEGRSLLQKYYYDFKETIDQQLTISEEDIKTTIDTIEKLKLVLNRSKDILDQKNSNSQ